MNYLEEYLRILLELAKISQNSEIKDEELYAEIDKVPGFREYLEEHAEEINQTCTKA